MSHTSRGRRLFFWLVFLILPVLILAVLEGALRVLGIAAPPPLFKEVRVGAVEGYMTNPDVGRRYFPPSMRSIMPQLGFQFFAKEKEPQTFRYFCLGASSAAGFPYHAHASFGGLLAARLEHLVPQRRIEAVNCAMAAINSHAVRDFVPEILEHDPDLLVIYMGHNEFYGAQGVGSISSLGEHTWSVALARALLRLRLAAVIRQALKIGHAREGAPPRGNVMETMAAEREIPATSPLRDTAAVVLARNLRAILDHAADRHVPVLLCEVASNLSDHSPFGSAHPPGLAVGAAFEDELARARDLLRQEDLDGALRSVTLALEQDSTYAAARFLKGRILVAAGRAAEALPEFVAAREYDTVPFRAPEVINRVIHAQRGRDGVHLVAVDSLFREFTARGAPAEDLFLEHLHFSPSGNGVLAHVLAAKLYELDLVAPKSQWRWQEDLPAPAYAAQTGVTELDLEIGAQRVHLLRQKWPYRRTPGPAESYHSQRDAEVVQLATSFIRKQIDLNESHNALARHYRSQGYLERALAEFLSSFRMFPLDPVPARAAAQLLHQLGRHNEALHLLDRALALDPRSTETLLWMARAFAGRGDVASARAAVARALHVDPRSDAALALRDSLHASAP